MNSRSGGLRRRRSILVVGTAGLITALIVGRRWDKSVSGVNIGWEDQMMKEVMLLWDWSFHLTLYLLEMPEDADIPSKSI